MPEEVTPLGGGDGHRLGPSIDAEADGKAAGRAGKADGAARDRIEGEGVAPRLQRQDQTIVSALVDDGSLETTASKPRAEEERLVARGAGSEGYGDRGARKCQEGASVNRRRAH